MEKVYKIRKLEYEFDFVYLIKRLEKYGKYLVSREFKDDIIELTIYKK